MQLPSSGDRRDQLRGAGQRSRAARGGLAALTTPVALVTTSALITMIARVSAALRGAATATAVS